MTSHPHSDLEVAPTSYSGATPYSDLEVAVNSSHDTHRYQYSGDPTDSNKIACESTTPTQNITASKTICGLQKRTFWIVVVAAIVVIAAAVGGGVGGALASRKSDKASGSSSTTAFLSSMQLSSTSSIPSSSSQSISTATIVGPTNSPEPTLLRDCPSSNNTVYSVVYGSISYQFRKLCSNSYQNANGFAYYVGGVVNSLDECINRCASYNQNNRTAIQAGRDPLCNAVCWRNTFDNRNEFAGGRCFGYTTRNTTVNGQTAFTLNDDESRCDGAALIN